MSGLVTAISTGTTAFMATNLDELVVLMMFFAQDNTKFPRRNIVVGQYLGFSVLVIASLPGFLSGLIVPRQWLGLLGFIPITIGLNCLVNGEIDSDEAEAETELPDNSIIGSFLSPQTYTVAAVTVANDGDNVSIYVPLFASSNLENLLVILGVFFLLTGVWCYFAYRLTRQPAVAYFLTRYGNIVIPFVLIGLGTFIVLSSGTLGLFKLIASCLCLMVLVKSNQSESEDSKN